MRLDLGQLFRRQALGYEPLVTVTLRLVWLSAGSKWMGA